MFGACNVIDREEQLVLAIRVRTPVEELPEVIGKSYQRVFAYMQEMGQFPVGAPFVGYFNMDMSDLDVEIGFPIGKALPEKDGIASSIIPAGRYAAMVYTGPYSDLKSAYKKLSEWIEENGLTPTYLAYEIYLNDPDQVKEEDLQTQILLSVK